MHLIYLYNIFKLHIFILFTNYKGGIILKKVRSKVALLLVLVIAFASLFSAVGTASALVGDYNGSGTLSTADATYLLYHTLFGGEEYPITQSADINSDGIINGDDAVYLLFNILFGGESYPIPLINVTLNNNGQVNTYEMVSGSQLNPLPDFKADSLNIHTFDGWYDSTFTTKYTTVPNTDITLYAKYDGYTMYNFDRGGYYDPNNKRLITAVDDPFGGEGKVLYTPIINKNDTVNYGFYRALAPSVNDGVSNSGFDFKKGHTYIVSFDYRFAANSPSDATCNLEVFAVDPAGIYQDGSKANVLSSKTLSNKGRWTSHSFTVTNKTDYKHLFLRLLGGSTETVYDFYLDNLVIEDITPVEVEGIKLVNGGITEISELQIGDELPVLSTYTNELSNKSFAFNGWYDETLTNKYTTVDSAVDTYYALFDEYTEFSFETGGMFDPNKKYSLNGSGISAWYRVWDPEGKDNICMRANLCSNGNNTHFALQLVEGVDKGFSLTADNKYIISFDYYVKSESVNSKSVSVRGSAASNIGVSGGKTNSFGSTNLTTINQWSTASMYFKVDSSVESYPYLIFMSQGNDNVSDLLLYIDNIVITVYSADEDVSIYTNINNIEFNDNGDVSKVDKSYIGADLPEGTEYYGAEFKGWYNDSLNAKYTTMPAGNMTLYSKYDGNVYNFENGGYYDPNGKFGSGSSLYSIGENPTDNTDNVITSSLKGNAGDNHFAFNASGYDGSDGYKLTVGNTYQISFMYYAEDLNENGAIVQFKGCKQNNIGMSGGKSIGYGGKLLNVEKQWTGVTSTFTYTGEELTDESSPYLIMMVQDGSAVEGAEACTATVYFDDIVIKEIEPEKTYLTRKVNIGSYTLGSKWLGFVTYGHYIVIPSNNFSYLAMMQCEELAKTIKGITSSSLKVEIITEDKWHQSNYQICIFVGDVKGHSRDNAYKVDDSNFTEDDYQYNIGDGNVYIDGGSPYALAMGISEFNKALEATTNGYKFSTGTQVSGKYSEKIDSYSTASYYRPTFLENFDQDEIDTTIWNVVDTKESRARDIVGSDGNMIYDGVIDDPENTPDEGTGHSWKMSRSAKDTYLENGCLVINGRYSEENKLFYGGMLRSHGQLEYLYGYLEVSCITAHGESLWSSVWTTPNASANVPGLYYPEVDVNECFGNARYSAFNMHTWPTRAGSNMGKVHYDVGFRGISSRKADAGSGKTFATDFHTFGFLWTPDGGKFTVDGQMKYQYNFESTSGYYNADIDTFHDRMSLIVSMTVGNPSSGSDPILGADYWNTTNKYIVDYVHIYQIDGQDIFYTPREAVEIDRSDLGER